MSIAVKQLALGTCVGGLIPYGVHAVGWALFPWVDGSVHDLREPGAVAAILTHLETLPGTYFLIAGEQRDGVGPGLWGWMTIHPPEAFSLGRSLLGGLVINFAVALLTVCVLLVVTGGYGRRVLVASAVGLVALLSGPIYFWAWA